jgi:hypothetical protein
MTSGQNVKWPILAFTSENVELCLRPTLKHRSGLQRSFCQLRKRSRNWLKPGATYKDGDVGKDALIQFMRAASRLANPWAVFRRVRYMKKPVISLCGSTEHGRSIGRRVS